MDDEQFKSISFLPNPNIDFGKLYYIVDKKEIYVNLFEFSIKRDLKIYKYLIEKNLKIIIFISY